MFLTTTRNAPAKEPRPAKSGLLQGLAIVANDLVDGQHGDDGVDDIVVVLRPQGPEVRPLLQQHQRQLLTTVEGQLINLLDAPGNVEETLHMSSAPGTNLVGGDVRGVPERLQLRRQLCLTQCNKNQG